MAYVAAFAVSQYANAKYRTTRKPFNPIMGETYELVREDLGKLELGLQIPAYYSHSASSQASASSQRKSCILHRSSLVALMVMVGRIGVRLVPKISCLA
jgi:hypothetical protein